MVLDLMLGGDLRFHLDRMGSMAEEVVRFYVAELALGVAYLHEKGIVHRCVLLHSPANGADGDDAQRSQTR